MTKSKKFWARLGILSLACVMVTSAVVGITFAKYIRNTNNTSQTATVASFVTITWTDDDTFDRTYTTTDTAASELGIANSVVMAGDIEDPDGGIAPGTNGTSTVVFGANSEVAYKAQLDLTRWVYDVEDWVVLDVSETDYSTEGAEDITYQPVMWTVTTTQIIDGTSRTKNIINNATIEQMKALCDEGTNIWTIGSFAPQTPQVTVTISWEWLFEAGYHCISNDTTTDLTPEVAPAPDKVNYPVGAMLSATQYEALIGNGTITAANWAAIPAQFFGAYQYLNEPGDAHSFTSEGGVTYQYGDVITTADYNNALTANEKAKFYDVTTDLADTILADRATYMYTAANDEDIYEAGALITKAEYEDGIMDGRLTAGNWTGERQDRAPTITFNVIAQATQID